MKRLLWIIAALFIAGSAQAQNALDDCSTAFAVYSTRLACENYTGDAMQVMRTSDWAQAEIPFTAADTLDTDSLTNFCAGTDCRVRKWYSQISGDPALETSYLNGIVVSDTTSPHIVYSGVVVRDAEGKPVIDFAGNAALYTPTALGTSIDADSSSVYMKFDLDSLDTGTGGYEAMFQLGTNTTNRTSYTWQHSAGTQVYFQPTNWTITGSLAYHTYGSTNTVFSLHIGGVTSDSVLAYGRNALIQGGTGTISDHVRSQFVLGSSAKNSDDPGWHGKIGELIALPYQQGPSAVLEIYDDMNAYWGVGPVGYHPNAILPQQYDSDIAFYNQLEAWNDTTLFSIFAEFPNYPTDTLMVFNASADYTDALSDEQVANLYLKAERLTVNSVTELEPGAYVLDDGDGRGIEATGSVRIEHEPDGGGPGNPPRQWCNETSALYALDIPRPGLPNGNALYKRQAVGRRALVCAMVSMMMYREYWDSGYASWPDGHFRAALDWASVYRDAGELLDSTAAWHYRDFLRQSMQKVISYGGLNGSNTNLEVFGYRAAAIIYTLPDAEADVKNAALRALKLHALGDQYADISAYTTAYEAGLSTSKGAYGPMGCFLEGGQCEFFYQGESKMHLIAAIMEAKDRATGALPDSLQFMQTMLDNILEHESAQVFADPGKNNPGGPAVCDNCFKGGTGYSGRTGGGPLAQQTDIACMDYMGGYASRHGIFWAEERQGYPSRATMLSSIETDLASVGADVYTPLVLTWDTNTSDEDDHDMDGLNGRDDTDANGTTDDYDDRDDDWYLIWNEDSTFSPWVKINCPTAPVGWWDELQLWRTFAPQYKLAPFQRTDSINVSFDDQYWSYFDTDETGERFGFYIETQPHQGSYGGWYGGKIETMWADSVGVMVLNRHGKTGTGSCSQLGDPWQDSGCYRGTERNIDNKAATHTWGANRQDSLFTTTAIRGQEINRPVTYNLGAASPTVSITSMFNDPARSSEALVFQGASRSGMESLTVLSDSIKVTHQFTALTNGLQVDVTVTTTQQDSLRSLQTTIPIYNKDYDETNFTGVQGNMSDATIERDSSGVWVSMREEDSDVDGYPDWVDTQYLRICRDWEIASLGNVQCWYIDFTATESVRLSAKMYGDTYQTNDQIRPVHVDLHGSPGTTIMAPASASVTYKLLTTDPTQ